jgi:hypothetical protein
MPLGTSNYPTSLDDATTLPDVSGKNQNDAANLHSDLTDASSQAIKALEAKLGIGSSTAAAATTGWVPVKQGDGTTAWAAVPVGTPSGTVAPLDPATASTAGVASAYSRGDHKHLWKPIFKVRWTFDTVTSPLTGLWIEDVDQAATLMNFRLVLGTVASAGSNTKVDLLKNNVSVLTTQPEITVGQQRNSIAVVFANTALVTGDLLVPKITQGSSGAQLVCTLTYRWELT